MGDDSELSGDDFVKSIPRGSDEELTSEDFKSIPCDDFNSIPWNDSEFTLEDFKSIPCDDFNSIPWNDSEFTPEDFKSFCDNDEENGREKKKIKKKSKKKTKKTIKKTAILDPLPLPPAPELPAQFRERIERMNGYEVGLVIQKCLYPSDVNENLGRFSIPTKQIRTEFLRDDEKEFLDNRNGKEIPDIKALLIEPSCTAECTVSLRKWEMPKKSGSGSSIYNLVSTWRSIVTRNTLEDGMLVQLWAFRVESKLCFALVKVDGGDRDGGSGSSSSSSSSSSNSSSTHTGLRGAPVSTNTQHNFGQQD